MGVLGSAFATVAREAAMAATLATGLNAQEPAFTSPNPAVEVTAQEQYDPQMCMHQAENATFMQHINTSNGGFAELISAGVSTLSQAVEPAQELVHQAAVVENTEQVNTNDTAYVADENKVYTMAADQEHTTISSGPTFA